MKTYSAKSHEIDRKWFVVDASTAPLGRICSRVASILRGKHKPMYTPHLDTGDHVIIVNADQLVLTGAKMSDKTYARYSGFQSGLRERTAQEQMDRDSTVLVVQAVKGMLPKNRLGRQMLTKLKVYAGSEHPHDSQKPEPLTFES